MDVWRQSLEELGLGVADPEQLRRELQDDRGEDDALARYLRRVEG